MKYRSVSFCTSNEQRLREVGIDYDRTWWEALLLRPGKTEVWVGGTVWYNKDTGERASRAKATEIDFIVKWFQTKSNKLDINIG